MEEGKLSPWGEEWGWGGLKIREDLYKMGSGVFLG
jgi:hypothetical protein